MTYKPQTMNYSPEEISQMWDEMTAPCPVGSDIPKARLL